MTWVKLDDGFFMHPKALAAGRYDRDLYLAGLCWSAGQETDGLIPAHALALIAMVAGVADADQAASRLAEVGLWITDVDGWQIRRYGDWQTTRAERDAWRAKERERSKKNRNGPKQTDTEPNVRETYARTTRVVRDLDVDVDVDVELSSSGDSYPQSGRQPADDDDRPKQAMQHVASALAAKHKARSPAYARTVIRTGDQLPELQTLAAAHPDDTPSALALRYLDHLDQPPPPTVRCARCHAISHPTERCPTT